MRPHAAKGSIDVWRIDLGEEALDGLGGLLCAGERERAARLVRERDRLLWTRSRGVLRVLLGRYLDRDPRRLRFVLGPYGKPALASETRAQRCSDQAGRRAESGWSGRAGRRPRRRHEGGGHDLSFNLSHSGELMLLAVTAGIEVGVDVERARERYEVGFLKEWTRREAIVKCFGTGLARARIDLDGGLDAVGVDGKGAPWTAELDVGQDAFAAVAATGGPCELRRLGAPTGSCR